MTVPGARVPRHFVAAAGLLGTLGVAAGAFAAHGLRGRLAPDMLAVFATGARYALIHALALLGTGLAAARWPGRLLHAAGSCFLAGTVLFSGSLFALALTGVRAFGAVTPVGGLVLLAGWICLGAGCLGVGPEGRS